VLSIVPGVSVLQTCGTLTWIWLCCAALLIWKRRKDLLPPFLLLAFCLLTTLASPVNGEFRYHYAFATCAPILLAAALTAKKRDFSAKG